MKLIKEVIHFRKKLCYYLLYILHIIKKILQYVSENEFKYDEKITSKREFIVLVQKIFYFIELTQKLYKQDISAH